MDVCFCLFQHLVSLFSGSDPQVLATRSPKKNSRSDCPQFRRNEGLALGLAAIVFHFCSILFR
jgi:hypothetical protein